MGGGRTGRFQHRPVDGERRRNVTEGRRGEVEVGLQDRYSGVVGGTTLGDGSPTDTSGREGTPEGDRGRSTGRDRGPPPTTPGRNHLRGSGETVPCSVEHARDGQRAGPPQTQ